MRNKEEKKILAGKIDDAKKELLRTSEISLILDTYDDIFSDFDPRPYHQRSLSDDFLFEARKASRELKAGIQLKFLMPKFLRNSSDELLIKRRLREHFKKNADEIKIEKERMIRQGIYFIVSGIILMFLASIILFKSSERSIISSFFIVFLEPAGWFLFWEGLDLVIFEAKKKKPDLEFYEKMSKCEVSFVDY